MPVLGNPAARTLGMMWLLKYWLALGNRAHPDRPHALLIDEARLFQHGALPSILAEGRKFGLGAVIAHQDEAQLTTALRSALDTNASSFVTFRCGLDDAPRASVRLGGWPAGDLVRMPALRTRDRIE